MRRRLFYFKFDLKFSIIDLSSGSLETGISEEIALKSKVSLGFSWKSW